MSQTVLLIFVVIVIILIVYIINKIRSGRRESIDTTLNTPTIAQPPAMVVKKNTYTGMPANDTISVDKDFIVYHDSIIATEEDPHIIPDESITADNCLDLCRKNDACRMAVMYDNRDACNPQKSCKLYDFQQSPGHVIYATDPSQHGNAVIPDMSLSLTGATVYSVSDSIACRQIAGNRPATFFVDPFNRMFCAVKGSTRALGDTYIKRPAQATTK